MKADMILEINRQMRIHEENLTVLKKNVKIAKEK